MRVDMRHPPVGETDWERVRTMSDGEALRNAEADPDCPPIEADASGQLRAVVQPQWLRLRLGMSQRMFADTFGFSIRSLQAWEKGVSQPSRAIRAYLRVIAGNPEAAIRALMSEKRARISADGNSVTPTVG